MQVQRLPHTLEAAQALNDITHNLDLILICTFLLAGSWWQSGNSLFDTGRITAQGFQLESIGRFLKLSFPQVYSITHLIENNPDSVERTQKNKPARCGIYWLTYIVKYTI